MTGGAMRGRFAGHDTTASLVAWALYFLSRDPSAEAQLIQEVDEVLGDLPADATPTDEHIARLRFMTLVLKESLRLAPPASTARWAPPGTTVKTSDGRELDISSSVVYVPTYLLHMNKGFWGADAGEFRPRRWEGLEPGAYFLPFAKGPRDCIGQNFGEAFTVWLRLLR
jgi:cytokinin trans-hydroxylase